LVVRSQYPDVQDVPHRDMRDYLAVLEQHGKLKRVRKTVDRTWEPGVPHQVDVPGDASRRALWADVRAGRQVLYPAGDCRTRRVRSHGRPGLGVEPDEINDKVVDASITPRRHALSPVIRAWTRNPLSVGACNVALGAR